MSMSKILVVDDDLTLRTLCRDIFTQDGHDVKTASSGEQVFILLKSEKPDLILMDIQIPGENGLSLLRRLPKSLGYRIPVVIFSAHVTSELEKEAFENGAVEVIQKDTGACE